MSGTDDVIVIGSGAGGGTLVDSLAASGRPILLLERGDWRTREPRMERLDVRQTESELAHVA